MHFITQLPTIRILGQGSFGQVHLCHDLAHGPVAVKFFYQTNFTSTGEWLNACKDALEEAQNMKALEHRNVVPIYQVVQSQAGDSFAIVMQFCDQGTLGTLPASNRIKLHRAKTIIRDAGIGLSYIHNKGFIHRDIKPDNIFQTSSGDIKIGDFGFVTDKLVFGFSGGAGTPEYIAPEVRHTRKCSSLSDVYSLGVTFLHMTHGDCWFRRKGNGACLKEITFDGQLWDVLSDDYTFLPHIPVEWRNTLKRMCNADSGKRHQSMDEAVNAVSRLPLVEDWECYVTPASVSWSLIKGQRRVRVEWTDYLAKNQAWEAWSEDQTGNRRRALKKSSPSDSPIKRYRSLQEFFASRTL